MALQEQMSRHNSLPIVNVIVAQQLSDCECIVAYEGKNYKEKDYKTASGGGIRKDGKSCFTYV